MAMALRIWPDDVMTAEEVRDRDRVRVRGYGYGYVWRLGLQFMNEKVLLQRWSLGFGPMMWWLPKRLGLGIELGLGLELEVRAWLES
jgi:hypothetical protein